MRHVRVPHVTRSCYAFLFKTHYICWLIIFVKQIHLRIKSLKNSVFALYFILLVRKELFRGMKIDLLEKDWKVYPVFHIDFNGSNFMKRGI